MYPSIDSFLEKIKKDNNGEVEFHQAVHEVVESIWSYLQNNPQLRFLLISIG